MAKYKTVNVEDAVSWADGLSVALCNRDLVKLSKDEALKLQRALTIVARDAMQANYLLLQVIRSHS